MNTQSEPTGIDLPDQPFILIDHALKSMSGLLDRFFSDGAQHDTVALRFAHRTLADFGSLVSYTIDRDMKMFRKAAARYPLGHPVRDELLAAVERSQSVHRAVESVAEVLDQFMDARCPVKRRGPDATDA